MQYVVIDFEATCDEPHNPDPQELIEFPAVVVDAESDTHTVEFRTYVRPVAHPLLTPFCVGLTGIRQEQVDQAPTFPEVLRQFEEWLQVQFPQTDLAETTASRRAALSADTAAPSGDFLMVTCGDWDLGSMLPRQCAQHHLPVPAWANRWANLKRIFAWHFPHAGERVGLAEMAAALDLPLVGRPHSGIDDARNIARILGRLLEMDVVAVNTAFWRCLACGTENLHRARECRQCGRSCGTLQEGDWACPKCGFANFARRDRCFDCGTPREVGSAPASSAPALKPGDWICDKCGGHNFARRRDCYQCGSARR
jgi:inhibitor of KinA sporulation pathway (predicted exonuclease)